ncbi:MAG: DUF177 domain-containing protein [Candidatus Marinimicrobia bacterium]|jgi:uncharacterized protein|nr:DUF177 domain-containing protein [Candidatus Neomarinimicrobiota bacterium]MBT3947487.1 DUF177 domain-containing protein [Candidatus Neomarinimicrobiota bacterium]MBT4308571.1 DUF177 domain-containing protein [Candidatus Neomarinimicrobiota bacterium]MBT4454002.1 DUF177 domain-containing protein [Candidatus Neomarinimicrobiota bacterium]MBT5386401.1 DUF177 domain-containing protein [Candidatus Neomarinimicrobiota bacterium]|tara:strand:+ start:94 stop:591 length:498 start_codon:yes stop_codon:yes gene_type:complete
MKLFRTDLEKLISNRLFEISTESLNLEDVQVASDKLSCTLSVDHAPNGYRIHGSLCVVFLEKCDRCLRSFEEKRETNMDIILTDNVELLNNENIDVIHFSDSDEFIDLSSIVHDLILLEEPIKRLCGDSCEGLCLECGVNLNESKCNCGPRDVDSQWGPLKELKN